MKFDMRCPECQSNKWKLGYEGDSRAGVNDKTENVDTSVGVYGWITIICLECGYEQEMGVGSD